MMFEIKGFRQFTALTAASKLKLVLGTAFQGFMAKYVLKVLTT